MNLEAAQQALFDALNSSDEWFAVEFCRDHARGLIEEVRSLREVVNSLEEQVKYYSHLNG